MALANRYSQTSQEQHQIPFASFFNNLLASSLALKAIGSIRVESFAIACALLVGLFFYDVFWVFGTVVTMTVATKVEAPIKFLFPADPASICTSIISLFRAGTGRHCDSGNYECSGRTTGRNRHGGRILRFIDHRILSFPLFLSYL